MAGTLQSLSVVEAKEFKDMMHAVDARVIIPSRKHLSTTLITGMATEIQHILVKKLNEANELSLTVDIWSNRQMRSCIGITANLISKWMLYNAMLACRRFKGHSTADNIDAQFEEIVSNFGITYKVTEVELPEVPLAVENRTLMILREYLRPN